jgi:hypothetical protein
MQIKLAYGSFNIRSGNENNKKIIPRCIDGKESKNEALSDESVYSLQAQLPIRGHSQQPVDSETCPSRSGGSDVVDNQADQNLDS